MFKLQLFVILGAIGWAKSAPKLDGLIVGGDIANITDYPHQASLLRNGNYFCGGFIVHIRWVVTAAHCTVFHNSPEGLIVRVGSDYRDRGGISHSVVSLIHNPRFSMITFDFDVAMLRVARDFAWSESVKPILFDPTDCDPIGANDELRVSGYGETLEEVDDPTRLRSVQVYKITNEACEDKYAAYTFPVTETMICAGVMPEGGRDACQGDSGGALIKGECAYGIVSWGIGCAEKGYPGVYARISTFSDWMQNIIKLL